MTRPSRRGILGGLAVLAAPTLPAIAGVPASADTELIQACARYLELERIMADPRHPDAAKDTEDMPEYPEYSAAEEVVSAAAPATPEGWAALATVALLCSAAIDDAQWDDGEETLIAHKVLRHLAGPAVAREEDRRAEVRSRRREESLARLNAEIAARPAPSPYRDTRTPAEKVEGWRRVVATAEEGLRKAEAEMAAQAVPA